MNWQVAQKISKFDSSAFPIEERRKTPILVTNCWYDEKCSLVGIIYFWQIMFSWGQCIIFGNDNVRFLMSF